MASSALRRHLKGRLSINLVVLLVILLLGGEKFLVREEDVFVPVLGVPLEQMDFLQSRGKEMSFDRRCALMCRLSQMIHDFFGRHI